jgi:hypothetical protein
MVWSGNAGIDWYSAVSLGLVPGMSIVHKYGRNGAVPNGSWEAITPSGAINFLQAATPVRIKAGGNAADTAAGAGARKITVEGLDSNLALATEEIVTAGASASSVTAISFWRIFRAYVSDDSTGAYGGSNTGAITVENGAGGTDLIQIGSGEGQSQFGSYSIPVGKTGYVIGGDATVNGVKAASVRGFVRANLNKVTTPFSPKKLKIQSDGILGQSVLISKSARIILPQLSDIWFEANGGGAATEASVDFEILLVDN